MDPVDTPKPLSEISPNVHEISSVRWKGEIMPSGEKMHGPTLPVTHLTRIVRSAHMAGHGEHKIPRHSGFLSAPDLNNPGRKGRWTPAWGLIHRRTQKHVKNAVMWFLFAHPSMPASLHCTLCGCYLLTPLRLRSLLSLQSSSSFVSPERSHEG